MKTLRKSNLIRCVSTTLTLTLMILTASECLADTVVLRDGSQYEGRLANRIFYLEGIVPSDYVGIMTVDPESDSEKFVRIRTQAIDYIVLGEGADAEYLDPAALGTRPPEQTDLDHPARFSDSQDPDAQVVNATSTGIVLIVLGLVASGVGVFKKLGGSKLRTETGVVSYEQDSYNAANYVLIIGGAAMTFGGIFTLTTHRTPPEPPGVIGGDTVTSMGLAFRF